MRYEIRELGVGGVLDQAIKLTKENFGLFFKIGLVLLICLLGLGFYTLSVVSELQALAEQQQHMRPGEIQVMPAVASSSIALGVISLLYALIVYPLVNAAMIYGVSNCYLDNPIGVGGAYRRALRVLLPLVGTWILVVLCIAGIIIPGVLVASLLGLPLGLLAFVPVVIFLVIFCFWIFLIQQVVVIEGKSGTGAIQRSRQLMKGNVATAFILALVLAAIGWGINMISELIPAGPITVVLAAFLQVALFIFGAAAWVVFYFSCRCKAENFDLTILAEAVGEGDVDETEWAPSPNG